MSATRRTIFKWCLGTLLVLLLIAACAASLATYQRAKYYYRELNAVRLDPLGLRRFEVPSPPEDLALVFYGDSRAAEWPEPPWLAGRTLNLGIGAQTTEQILARFDCHLAPLSPRIVLLQAGINDLKTIPLFPDAEGAIIERCKENIRNIVSRCRERGAHVIVTTIFPVGKLPLERSPVWSDRVDPAIDEVNQHIQSLASEGVTVFVSAEVLAGADGHVASDRSRDFLHLSETGYKWLNEALRRRVEEIISGTHHEAVSETASAEDGGGGIHGYTRQIPR